MNNREQPDNTEHSSIGNRSAAFDIAGAIEHIAHWLPTQGPIKDFIHHNTLHAVQHLPFHEGIAVAAKVFGARSYLPLAEYQSTYRNGRIKEFAIDWALQHTGYSEETQRQLRERLFAHDDISHYPPLSLANQGIRNAWINRLEIDLNSLAHPVVFRLLSNFLDQGISRWSLANDGERFWNCVLRLAQHRLLPLYPLNKPGIRELLSDNADDVINSCLDKIVGDPTLYQQYVLEMQLAHPGWSGMVRIIENTPEVLQNTLNVFSLQEDNLEQWVRLLLWDPLKRIDARINGMKLWFKVVNAVTGFAMFLLVIDGTGVDSKFLALPLAAFMVLASLSAFSLKHSPIGVWNAIGLSSVLAGLAVWFLNPDAGYDIAIFASGIIPSWPSGLLVLAKLLRNDNFADSPFAYRALAETQPRLSLLLFLSFLGLIGFPITPAFLGEDLLLSHASGYAPLALPADNHRLRHQRYRRRTRLPTLVHGQAQQTQCHAAANTNRAATCALNHESSYGLNANFKHLMQQKVIV